jgi:uncharacterized protein (DUF433 family)/DNA-binding transcriptional MerR regulator
VSRGEPSAEPRGRYLAREAGWLAGVSGERIGQWARRGYIRSSWSEEIPRVYSFQDVAESIMVHALLDRGAKHSSIKQTIGNLRARYGDWPLSAADLWTTEKASDNRGSTPIVLKEQELLLDIGHGTGGQLIMPSAGDLRRVQGLLRRGGWAIFVVPEVESIEVDPDRLSGRPTIRGTRIAAERVAEIAHEAGGLRILTRDYGLAKRQIEDAIKWYEAVNKLEVAA